MRQHTHALVCVSNSFPFFRILETVNSKWKKILTGILDQEVHSALKMAYLSAYLPHISCLLNFNDLNYFHSEMENHFSVTFNYTPTTAFLKWILHYRNKSSLKFKIIFKVKFVVTHVNLNKVFCARKNWNRYWLFSNCSSDLYSF